MPSPSYIDDRLQRYAAACFDTYLHPEKLFAKVTLRPEELLRLRQLRAVIRPESIPTSEITSYKPTSRYQSPKFLQPGFWTAGEGLEGAPE